MLVRDTVMIDLLRPASVVLHVTQDDSVREVHLILRADGSPFYIAEDAEEAAALLKFIVYKRPDGVSGEYEETLGEDAVEVVTKEVWDSEQSAMVDTPDYSEWICRFDGACFAKPGKTRTTVRFMDENGHVLHMFPIDFDVVASGSGITEPNEHAESPTLANLQNQVDNMIDSTLSVLGKAADAKATGDKIEKIQSAISVNYADAALWGNGGISSSAGTDTVSTTRLRTAMFPWSVYAVSCNDGYKFMVFCYEGTTYKGTWNGSIVQKSATWHTSAVNLNNIGNYNFRFVFAKYNDANISSSDGTNCIFTGYVDKTLSQKGKAADAFATKQAMDSLGGKVFEDSKKFIPVDSESAPGAVAKNGFYCARASSTKMEVKTLSGYNTFYFKLQNDAEFYCADNISLFRICTIKNGTETESGGNINISGTDCTEYNSGSFPTSASKISLNKGDYIAVSATTSNILAIMMSFDEIKDTVVLGNRQTNQVKTAVLAELGSSVKSPMCQYADNILAVYLPSGSGYIRYDFKHDTDVSKNADVWRVNNAFAVANDLSVIAQMTTSGEWECALHLSGRDDFSGGIAHGDEMVQEITFILDGSKVSISDLSTRRNAFSELRIVEFSYMYDPDDHTTKICDHGSEHVFTRDGLTINQSVKWAGTFEATSCYMAMYPASKNGDDKIYMDTSYDLVTLPASDYRNTYSGVKSVGVFSDTANICAVFAVPKYVDGLAGGDTLLVLDNGGLNYHKMYYVVTTGKTVANGEMWQTQTVYKLNAGE